MRLNTLLTSFALLSGWYLLTSTIKDPNNPPVARTGAPGESTCAASGCHTGGTYTGSVTMSAYLIR